MDRFTKMAHFMPTTEKANEEDLVDLHIKNVWKLHGLPLIHSTDRHGNFTSKYIQKMFKSLGIEQRFSTAYHPQTQGQVENLNGWLEQFLRMFCDHRKENWADLLPMAEFAWNNHHHSLLDMTPFYANTGMHPTMTDIPSEGQYDIPKRIKRILESQAEIKAQLLRSQKRQAEVYNQGRSREPNFEAGDMVYVSTANWSMDEGSKKLSDRCTGPFKIIKKVGEGAYQLELPDYLKVHNVFNVTLLTRHRPDPIPNRKPPEPKPILVDDHEEYTIKKFINSNWYGNHFQYKVRYEGYSKDHNEWLFRDDRLEDLGDESLKDFEEEFYGSHPTVKRHTDEVRSCTQKKRGFRKK